MLNKLSTLSLLWRLIVVCAIPFSPRERYRFRTALVFYLLSKAIDVHPRDMGRQMLVQSLIQWSLLLSKINYAILKKEGVGDRADKFLQGMQLPDEIKKEIANSDGIEVQKIDGDKCSDERLYKDRLH